jgi:hypothetical protein
MNEPVDAAVVGAGAAGLMAAIQAGRAARRAGISPRIVILERARRIGAKILVAGGGRCNVTHATVDETAFAGSSPHAIRRVLLRFDVPETTEFFRELGVELKCEETGKLFPVTDQARTVLDALLRAARDAGVEIRHPWPVAAIEMTDEGFLLRRRESLAGRGEPEGRERDGSADVEGGTATLSARRVILATGGKSLPKSGSDGLGYGLAQSLGHTITPHLLPALVPLTLPREHFLCSLRGVSFPATVELRSGTGKRRRRFTGPVLCAHFGLTGPTILDMSRHYLYALLDDPEARIHLNVLPGESTDVLDQALRTLGSSTPISYLRRHLPERLAQVLIGTAGLQPGQSGARIGREERRRLVRTLTELCLPITGSRGFTFAEATAGGVPLSELRLETMESRACPGLFLCGEICDVDGRIGGYNFQWAWASGAVVGTSMFP